jgi:hypothetical protein
MLMQQVLFNAADWYWFVGGDQVNVYASKRNIYVDSTTDTDYQAWVGIIGGPAISIGTEAEIWPSLQAQAVLPDWMFDGTTFSQPADGVYTKTQLSAYSANARYAHASGGVIISSLSPVSFLSDPVSRNTMASALDYVTAHSGTIVQWKMSDGTFIAVDHTALTTMVNDVAGFVQGCFTCESNTAASINAGTITTLAAIDSAYAAISNVFP